jgi:hypothetical protein
VPTCSSSTTARRTAPPTSPAPTAPRCSRSARTAACARASRPATRGRATAGTRTAAASTQTASIRRPSSRDCSRYHPSGARRLGTALLRRAVAVVLQRPFADATSGLYAVNAKALPLLAAPFKSGAPEVEALIRIAEAGLRLEEVPVDMAARASGESKLRGGKAARLVVTVVGTLVLAKVVRSRRG